MRLSEALDRLEALGTDKLRAQNAKRGVTGSQYGVKLGDIRTLAKEIKTDHSLALELWDSSHFEARLLATLVMKPKQLSATELDRMVRANTLAQVADWLGGYVVKVHPEKEKLRQRWMESDHPMGGPRRLEPDR